MRTLSWSFILVVGCSSEQEFMAAESPPPMLSITSPVRGSWQPDGAVGLMGETQNLSRLIVNGEVHEIDDGPFSIPLDLHKGIHYIEIEAQGEDGHTLFDRRSVIAGDFAPAVGPLENPAELRINEGGLDDLADIVSGLIDTRQLNEDIAAVNPLVEMDYSWGTSLTMDFTNIYFNTPQIEVSPVAEQLEVEIILPNLFMDTDSLVSVLWVDSNQQIEMFSEQAVIHGAVNVVVQDGVVEVESSEVTVELQGFSYDASLLPGEIVESHLFEDTIRESMEESLALAMDMQIPEILASLQEDLDLGFDFEVMGTQMLLEAGIGDLGVDSEGVWMELGLELAAGQQIADGKGYLYSGVPMPSADRSADGALMLSDDTLNRVVYELWTGGLFSQIFTTEDGSISREGLEEIGISFLTVTTTAGLPPVLVESDGELEVQFGEMEVSVTTPGFTPGERVVLRVAGSVGVELVYDDGDVRLLLNDLELHLDVVETDWLRDHESMLELVEGFLTPELLLGTLEDLSISVPSIDGLTIDSVEISRAESGVHTGLLLNISPD